MIRLLCLLCLLLGTATSALAEQSSGALWRVHRVLRTPEARLDQAQAEAWLHRAARITQTAISFEGRSCRVVPQITTLQAGILLATLQTTPAQAGIPDQELQRIETGCDIPGFETMLALQDGQFVLLHEGTLLFLTRDSREPQRLRTIDLPEAGLRLSLPEAVRILEPGAEPGQGLGFWYELAPLQGLGESGRRPFVHGPALRQRAALRAGEPWGAPGDAVPGSMRAVTLGNGTALAYTVLRPGLQPCSLAFQQHLVLYRAGLVLHLVLVAAPERLVRENPGYFSQQDCEARPHWDLERNMDQAFWSALNREGLGGLAQQWQEAQQTLLRQSEVRGTPTAPSFLATSHEPCRSLPPRIWNSEFPGAVLVPEQTFALALPYGLPGGETPGRFCLATLELGQTQRQILVRDGMLEAALQPLAALRQRTRALALDDLNADGLPDIVAMLESPGPDGQWQPDNRVYLSRPTPAAPERERLSWQPASGYERRIRHLPTAAAVLQELRGLRAALEAMVGQELELVGTVEQQFGSLVLVPETMEQPMRLLLQATEPLSPPELHVPGQRAWIRARILDAEDSQGLLTLFLEIQEARLLEERLLDSLLQESQPSRLSATPRF